MQVMSGHKGKVNAAAFIKEKKLTCANNQRIKFFYISELIQGIQNIQTNLINNSDHDHDFEVPYTTLQVGKIEGGVANIVPSSSTLLLEIRNIANDNPNLIIKEIEQKKLLNHILINFLMHRLN